MFKVFIYLYIFLESVLCKAWFWWFAHRKEAGAWSWWPCGWQLGSAKAWKALSSDGSDQLSDGRIRRVLTGPSSSQGYGWVWNSTLSPAHLPHCSQPTHPRNRSREVAVSPPSIDKSQNWYKGCSGRLHVVPSPPKPWVQWGRCCHASRLTATSDAGLGS